MEKDQIRDSNIRWDYMRDHAWRVNELAYQRISKEDELPVYCGSYRLPGGKSGEILAVRHSRTEDNSASFINVEAGIIYDYNYQDRTKPYTLFSCKYVLSKDGQLGEHYPDIKVESVIEDATNGKIKSKVEIIGAEKENKLFEMSDYLLKATKKELREIHPKENDDKNPVVVDFLPQTEKTRRPQLAIA